MKVKVEKGRHTSPLYRSEGWRRRKDWPERVETEEWCYCDRCRGPCSTWWTHWKQWARLPKEWRVWGLAWICVKCYRELVQAKEWGLKYDLPQPRSLYSMSYRPHGPQEVGGYEWQ